MDLYCRNGVVFIVHVSSSDVIWIGKFFGPTKGVEDFWCSWQSSVFWDVTLFSLLSHCQPFRVEVSGMVVGRGDDNGGRNEPTEAVRTV
jgi:hypothetical protein